MRILQFLASILLIVAFAFIFALPSSAMTLPQILSHDGLTFEHPLIIAKSQTLKPTTLTFGEIKEILVKKPTEIKVLAETIVSPPPIERKNLIDEVIPVAKAAEATKQTTPSLTPTKTPTPTPTEIPSPSPTQPPVSLPLSNGGLDAEKLFSMSNAYRASKGLPPFQKDERSCQLAASRAPEIAGEVAGGHMHSGLKARNLPYWNTENIISMRTEEAAFNWWVNDKIHHDAIIGNYTYSCVACHGNSCAQEFTNYQPK